MLAADEPPKSPIPSPAGHVSLPETFGYRLKRRLLGPPLVREQLIDERLSNPVALAILSSDVMSSSAYATEQILTILVPAVGLAAFSMVVPVTFAILAVLAVVTMCYREVVQAYPKAGGAYVVSRENFGLTVAQIASAALLVDYTLTVAVSVAAGVDALASAAPSLTPYITPICIAFVLMLAYGNLRGIREAGRSFAVPTFFFIANMALMIGIGVVRWATGSLHAHPLGGSGAVAIGHSSGGLLAGASLFIVMKAFASGGSALTGTEAISNGVSVFRDPQSDNARKTLVAMATILGSMFLGLSLLSAVTHPIPFVSGTPTVISQVGRFVYGSSPAGHLGYYALQGGTMAILILAANTSFTGFPFLANFAAQDSFLPRQLTRRGHRLVFSNGIVVLTIASVALLIATQAKVSSLIALYAIGVFTSFTMSGLGMAKHQLHHKDEAGWRRRLVITGSAGVLSLIVDLIFIITKFTEGAWVVVVLVPVMVFAFVRLNRQYEEEQEKLTTGAARAAEAPVLRRHVVFVFVDELDMAAARAIQYARALNPDELRAVHFMVDARHAGRLQRDWSQLGLSRLALEVIDCPDRRLTRAALELAAEATADGDTEVTILLPRRAYQRIWSRVLHDQTADRIVEAVAQLPHVNATIVPFHVQGPVTERPVDRPGRGRPEETRGRADTAPAPPDTIPIGQCGFRQNVRIAGRVRAVRVQPWSGVPSLEATIVDSSGDTIAVVFLGRRRVPGIEPGARLLVTGRVGSHGGRAAILNPLYEILAPAPAEE
ncbi:MAG TPA: amino acid permease [Acidimicrobiales bacterium]|nr:amino acid permease [Acidimicrobiales bacterium]